MDDFSSLRFSQLYLSTLFPPTSRINVFEKKIEICDGIEESIDKVIEYINDSNGFTVIGWYKRGRINDQNSSDETDDRIEAGKISYHIVSLTLTDKNIIFDNLKFAIGDGND